MGTPLGGVLVAEFLQQHGVNGRFFFGTGGAERFKVPAVLAVIAADQLHDDVLTLGERSIPQRQGNLTTNRGGGVRGKGLRVVQHPVVRKAQRSEGRNTELGIGVGLQDLFDDLNPGGAQLAEQDDAACLQVGLFRFE